MGNFYGGLEHILLLGSTSSGQSGHHKLSILYPVYTTQNNRASTV